MGAQWGAVIKGWDREAGSSTARDAAFFDILQHGIVAYAMHESAFTHNIVNEHIHLSSKENLFVICKQIQLSTASKTTESEAVALSTMDESKAVTLYFIRHGETDWNAEGRLQGQLDTPLNDHGRAQAHAAAVYMKHHHRVTAVWSSDLRRCTETAKPLAEQFGGLEVHTDVRLRESLMGHWQGQLWDDVTRDFPEEVKAWRNGTGLFAMPGGETGRNRYARVVSAVTEIALRNIGGAVAVVLHGGILTDVDRFVSGVAFGGKGKGLVTRPRVNAGITIIRFAPSPATVAAVASPEGLQAEVDKVRGGLFTESTVTGSSEGAAYGHWEIVEWGVTAHLALLPAPPPHPRDVHKPAVSNTEAASAVVVDEGAAAAPASTAPDATAAAAAAARTTGDDEIVPVAATDAETQALS